MYRKMSEKAAVNLSLYRTVNQLLRFSRNNWLIYSTQIMRELMDVNIADDWL